MTGAELIAWRRRMGLNKTQAAKLLGSNRVTLANYEGGRAEVPRYIALACAALSFGLPPIGTETPAITDA